jgi:glycosyltransferase involved in cell wall biosynthesis
MFIYILIRHWKAFEYFDRCIDSVLLQNYRNYKILFVDDASGYDIYRKKYITEKLKGHTVVFNKFRKYSVRNGYEMIHKYCTNHNGVVVNLDADDWLISSDVLDYLNSYYLNHPDIQITYGNCILWDGDKLSKPVNQINRYWNRPYPKGVIKNKSYRKYTFLPLHPRTWKVLLFKKIYKEDFLRPDGKWLRFAEDQAFFYPMLELSNGNIGRISKPLYAYNTATIHADNKINLNELLKDELTIRRKFVYDR